MWQFCLAFCHKPPVHSSDSINICWKTKWKYEWCFFFFLIECLSFYWGRDGDGQVCTEILLVLFSHMQACCEWVKSLSCVRLFVTPWTVACQAPLSKGFSRQEYWSGLPFPSPKRAVITQYSEQLVLMNDILESSAS